MNDISEATLCDACESQPDTHGVHDLLRAHVRQFKRQQLMRARRGTNACGSCRPEPCLRLTATPQRGNRAASLRGRTAARHGRCAAVVGSCHTADMHDQQTCTCQRIAALSRRHRSAPCVPGGVMTFTAFVCSAALGLLTGEFGGSCAGWASASLAARRCARSGCAAAASSADG
jgi:hypothetical protein